MTAPEIRFTDRCFEENIRPELGGLVNKLHSLANVTARHTFGKRTFLNPTNIELTPAVADGVSIVMRMWHSTSGPMPGVFQSHDTALRMGTQDATGEEFCLVTDEGDAVLLTARETLVLQQVAVHAIQHTLSVIQE